MRLVSFLIFFSIFCNADYLNNNSDSTAFNQCVKNLKVVNNGKIRFKLSSNNSVIREVSTLDMYIDGYVYKNNQCTIQADYLKLGLTENQWNNQLATLANNLGFTLLFLICFLAVLVMRK